MLARYVGPSEGFYTINTSHMAVNKPRNADDDDLLDRMGNIERPLSQPTEISYFLQRIRLAEICRKFTDRAPLVTSSPNTASYSDIMDVDVELNAFINDIPSFFRLDGDNLVESSQHNSRRASGIATQRYMLNSLIHTQRCKLHIPYLIRSSVNPVYASSRKFCIQSACLIIQAELQLEKESLPFVHIRLKFSGLLYEVFMASIVLLLDMCLNKTAEQQEARRVEVAEAFRILGNARDQSPTAANFLE